MNPKISLKYFKQNLCELILIENNFCHYSISIHSYVAPTKKKPTNKLTKLYKKILNYYYRHRPLLSSKKSIPNQLNHANFVVASIRSIRSITVNRQWYSGCK